jgi:L-lactate dehydrogenase (cytochrome)
MRRVQSFTICFTLAAAHQGGVERALDSIPSELKRDTMLMGCTSMKQLSPKNLRSRAATPCDHTPA